MAKYFAISTDCMNANTWQRALAADALAEWYEDEGREEERGPI